MKQPAEVVVSLSSVHQELMVYRLLLVIREVTVAVKEGHHPVLWPQLEADPVTKLWLASHKMKQCPYGDNSSSISSKSFNLSYKRTLVFPLNLLFISVPLSGGFVKLIFIIYFKLK